MVSREIDAALHVTRIMVLYRSPGRSVAQRRLLVGRCGPRGDSGHLRPGRGHRAGADRPVARRCGLRGPRRTRRPGWTAHARSSCWCRSPASITRCSGCLLIGEKSSEEPYTSKDRNLLQMVAAQVGSVYEVLALREQVGEHHRIQKEVLGRLERQHINLRAGVSGVRPLLRQRRRAMRRRRPGTRSGACRSIARSRANTASSD